MGRWSGGMGRGGGKLRRQRGERAWTAGRTQEEATFRFKSQERDRSLCGGRGGYAHEHFVSDGG